MCHLKRSVGRGRRRRGGVNGLALARGPVRIPCLPENGAHLFLLRSGPTGRAHLLIVDHPPYLLLFRVGQVVERDFRVHLRHVNRRFLPPPPPTSPTSPRRPSPVSFARTPPARGSTWTRRSSRAGGRCPRRGRGERTWRPALCG